MTERTTLPFNEETIKSLEEGEFDWVIIPGKDRAEELEIQLALFNNKKIRAKYTATVTSPQIQVVPGVTREDERAQEELNRKYSGPLEIELVRTA